MTIKSWKKAPTVEDLAADYTAAQSDTDSHISNVERWLNALNITGSARVMTPENRSEVQPKLIRKLNEWRYPTLTEPFMSTEDLFDVSPVTHEDKQSATQNALVLNNQVTHKIDKQKFIDEYVRTGCDEGTVTVKVAWKNETIKQEVIDYDYEVSTNPTETQRILKLAEFKLKEPTRYILEVPKELRKAVEYSLENEVTLVPVPKGTKVIEKTIRNHPVWEICDYRNVVIDPTCEGDLSKAEFVVHSFETSMSALKKDGRYSNLNKVESKDPLADPHYKDQEEVSFRFKDSARQKIVVHEYWGYWDVDGKGKTTPIVAAWIGNVLVRLEENPFDKGFLPFVTVQMLPVRKSNFGEPDAELIEDNQKIVGAVTRGAIDVMARSANAQIGTAKGVLDITNKRKRDRGEDYEFNPTVNPDSAFYMHKFPEIPQSVGAMIQSQISDAESLVGVRPFAQSNTGNIGSETAAGVKSAMDATSKRDTAILRRFSQGIVELGRMTIAMNQQFLEEEEIIRVTNEEFVPIRKDDLAGDFDLKVTISTAEEDQVKAQELSFMLQTMGNNMDPNMSKIILSEIATLRNMPVLAHEIKSYNPQPDPIAQEKARLEVELLKAQIQSTYASAQEDMSGARLDEAKASVEMSKSRQISSQADMQDLDFVERQSGISHQRDLEHVSQQSKAQAETKILEHELNRQAKMEDRIAEKLFSNDE